MKSGFYFTFITPLSLYQPHCKCSVPHVASGYSKGQSSSRSTPVLKSCGLESESQLAGRKLRKQTIFFFSINEESEAQSFKWLAGGYTAKIWLNGDSSHSDMMLWVTLRVREKITVFDIFIL